VVPEVYYEKGLSLWSSGGFVFFPVEICLADCRVSPRHVCCGVIWFDPGEAPVRVNQDAGQIQSTSPPKVSITQLDQENRNLSSKLKSVGKGLSKLIRKLISFRPMSRGLPQSIVLKSLQSFIELSSQSGREKDREYSLIER